MSLDRSQEWPTGELLAVGCSGFWSLARVDKIFELVSGLGCFSRDVLSNGSCDMSENYVSVRELADQLAFR